MCNCNKPTQQVRKLGAPQVQASRSTPRVPVTLKQPFRGKPKGATLNLYPHEARLLERQGIADVQQAKTDAEPVRTADGG